MITKELVEYIEAQRKSGVSDFEIRQNLSIGAGWTEADIDAGFKAAELQERQPQIQQSQAEPQVQPAPEIQPEPQVQPAPEIQPEPQVQQATPVMSTFKPDPISRPDQPIMTAAQSEAYQRFQAERQAQFVSASEPRGSKKLVITAIAVVVLLLGGAAAYAYWAGLMPASVSKFIDGIV